MRKAIRIDFTNHAIVLTREFQKLASDVRSDEYATLQRVRKDYPDFSVGIRAIKKNPNKNTYKNLTYSYMEKYIRTHEEKAQATEIFTELAEMYLLAQCHKNGVGYATIKSWFLDKYPDVKKFGIEEEKAEVAEEKTEATTTEEKAVA